MYSLEKLQKSYCSFVTVFLVAHLISNFVLCSAAESNTTTTKPRRNLICYFRLTGLIKRTLYNLLQDVGKYDPFYIGDIPEQDLENGRLTGLSTLTNITEVKVFCDKNDLIIFSTTLGMKNLEIIFQWVRWFLFRFTGTIWMKARDLNFKLEIAMNTTGGMNFQVMDVTVTKLEDFHVGFTGLGPLNPVVRGTMNLIYRMWSTRAVYQMESLIKNMLEERLNELVPTLDILDIL